MSANDGWTGVMTGLMRGRPLQRCRQHGGWWTVATPCPACRLERELASAKAEAARRCEGCRLRVIPEVH